MNWIKPDFKKGLVSVIIPTYNRADFIKESINSILNQSYTNIECIIVDDGSTDNTEEIINKIIESEPNIPIYYLRQNNSGAQQARNKGSIHSKGEFIQYLDSDDLLTPFKIERQVDYLINHQNVDGVYGDWEVGNPNEKKIITVIANKNILELLLEGQCIATLSFLMRRTTINNIGKWDVKIKRNQEIDYHLRGAIIQCKFNYQTGNCGLWRIHLGTRIANSTNLNEILFFFEKWIFTLHEKGLLSIKNKQKLGSLIFWITIENKTDKKNLIYKALRLVDMLDPDIPYFNTPKMKILRMFLGRDIALAIWFKYFLSNIKTSND